jgi:hypothetical protein
MAIETDNRYHAAIAISFAPGEMRIDVAEGIDVASVVHSAPGVVDVRLTEALGEGEVVIASSVGAPPPGFFVATAMVARVPPDPRDWQISMFAAGNMSQEITDVACRVTWFRAHTGPGPVRVVPI